VAVVVDELHGVGEDGPASGSMRPPREPRSGA
jgi:hypothetical protein